MTEEIISSAPISSAPAVDVSAPVTSPIVPAVEAQPIVAPIVEVAPVVEVKEVPSPETTLLTVEKEKPVEVKTELKAGEPTAPEISKDEPLIAPVFEAFKLPEGITVDETKIGEFTSALAEFESKTKASHEDVQQFGQSLIDRHIKGIEEAQSRLLEKLIDDGKKERDAWKDSFLKSPEFANRTDTVLNSAIDAIGIYGGTKDQQQEFRDLMASTGVGNHPAMIRMLSNMMIAKPEPKQLAAPTIAKAVPKSQMQKRYGSK